MTIETYLLTFAASAQQFPAPATAGAYGVFAIHVEPLRANIHASYTGTSAVTNNGSGTGVIKEHATPSSTVANDSLDLIDQRGDNALDPTRFYSHGYSGENMKVTYFIR